MGGSDFEMGGRRARSQWRGRLTEFERLHFGAPRGFTVRNHLVDARRGSHRYRGIQALIRLDGGIELVVTSKQSEPSNDD